MCDYSLEAYRSRPARQGERYKTSRFPSGSIGFTAPGDGLTAVCMACDTRLALEGLSDAVQEACGVGPAAEATFTRLETRLYRDAVRFDNGAELSLQRLGPGVEAHVLDALSEPRRIFETAELV